MVPVILNRLYSIRVWWRLLLHHGDDEIGPSSRFGPRAAPVLHTPVRTLVNSFRINYHQFADNTQLYTIIDPDSPHCLASLTAYADVATGWHIRNDFLLNPSKTKALVSGTRQQVAKLDTSNGIAVSCYFMTSSSTLWVLGVTLYEELTFDDHIFRIVECVTSIYAPCSMYTSAHRPGHL